MRRENIQPSLMTYIPTAIWVRVFGIIIIIIILIVVFEYYSYCYVYRESETRS